MKGWNIAAAAGALTMAAGIGAAVAPIAEGQERVARVEPRRAFDMMMGGSRIGVSIRDVEAADAKTGAGASRGVVVEDVTAGGPADKAGVRKGDVIAEFDGERVRSARQLTRLVQETPAARTVQAALVRDGQKTTVSITPDEGGEFSFDGLADLGEMARGFRYRYRTPPPPPPAPPAPRVAPTPPVPPTPPAVWDVDEMFDFGGTRLGMSVSPLTPQLADHFGAKGGVLVTSVDADSSAAKAGLEAGDVITSVNGSAVVDPGDLRRRIQRLNDADEFTLDVVRDRKPVVLKGKAERTERRRTRTTL